MSPPERKRRFQRKGIEAEFQVRDVDDVLGGELQFDALDLSEGGAFLASSLLLEIGEQLEVSFSLPGVGSIHVRARVAWVTRSSVRKGEPGMGLEFLGLSDKEQRAIKAYIER